MRALGLGLMAALGWFSYYAHEYVVLGSVPGTVFAAIAFALALPFVVAPDSTHLQGVASRVLPDESSERDLPAARDPCSFQAMSDALRLHEQRDRAESFGSIADDYERYRPDFPRALVDDLVAGAPRSALDVGAGTGKVSRALAARGVRAMGVEIDPRMAAVARRHGVTIEEAKFEDWDDAGRTFDLVACGDAWHWIDPARGAEKVARVLERGKTFARFFNLQVLDDDVVRALEGPYREHAKGAILQGQRFDGDLPRDPLADDPRFEVSALETYRWERVVGVERWLGFLGTVSDHLKLGREALAALRHAVRDALAPFGDLRVEGRTYAVLATRR